MTSVFRSLLLICLTAVTWLALTSDPMPSVFQVWDKLNHWVAFITLAFLADYSFPRARRNWIKWVSLAAYGLALEVIQRLSGSRYFEFLDLLTDIIGIASYLPLRGLIQRIAVLDQPGQPKIPEKKDRNGGRQSI
jgi:VanZ family protein